MISYFRRRKLDTNSYILTKKFDEITRRACDTPVANNGEERFQVKKKYINDNSNATKHYFVNKFDTNSSQLLHVDLGNISEP